MNENEKLYFDSDDDWGDIDFSDLTDEPEVNENDEPEVQSGADNAGAGGETNDSNAEGTDANQADGTDAQRTDEQADPVNVQGSNQSFVLRYMGEDREFSRDETTALAQKGMDYDRIRKRADDLTAERDNLKNSYNAAKQKADFLDELARRQKITPEQLIMNVRASVMAREENITQSEAEQRIAFNDREASLKKREEEIYRHNAEIQKQQNDEMARRSQFAEFFNAHRNDNGGKGVTPKDIPPVCYRDMQRGIPLEESYSKYLQNLKFEIQKADVARRSSEYDSMKKRIEEQEKELEELKSQYASTNQNELNRMRSVGSTASKGNQTKDSIFDAAWYDGT